MVGHGRRDVVSHSADHLERTVRSQLHEHSAEHQEVVLASSLAAYLWAEDTHHPLHLAGPLEARFFVDPAVAAAVRCLD